MQPVTASVAGKWRGAMMSISYGGMRVSELHEAFTKAVAKGAPIDLLARLHWEWVTVWRACPDSKKKSLLLKEWTETLTLCLLKRVGNLLPATIHWTAMALGDDRLRRDPEDLAHVLTVGHLMIAGSQQNCMDLLVTIRTFCSPFVDHTLTIDQAVQQFISMLRERPPWSQHHTGGALLFLPNGQLGPEWMALWCAFMAIFFTSGPPTFHRRQFGRWSSDRHMIMIWLTLFACALHKEQGVVCRKLNLFQQRMPWKHTDGWIFPALALLSYAWPPASFDHLSVAAERHYDDTYALISPDFRHHFDRHATAGTLPTIDLSVDSDQSIEASFPESLISPSPPPSPHSPAPFEFSAQAEKETKEQGGTADMLPFSHPVLRHWLTQCWYTASRTDLPELNDLFAALRNPDRYGVTITPSPCSGTLPKFKRIDRWSFPDRSSLWVKGPYPRCTLNMRLELSAQWLGSAFKEEFSHPLLPPLPLMCLTDDLTRNTWLVMHDVTSGPDDISVRSLTAHFGLETDFDPQDLISTFDDLTVTRTDLSVLFTLLFRAAFRVTETNTEMIHLFRGPSAPAGHEIVHSFEERSFSVRNTVQFSRHTDLHLLTDTAFSTESHRRWHRRIWCTVMRSTRLTQQVLDFALRLFELVDQGTVENPGTLQRLLKMLPDCDGHRKRFRQGLVHDTVQRMLLLLRTVLVVECLPFNKS